MHKILFIRTFKNGDKDKKYDTDLDIGLFAPTLKELFANCENYVLKIPEMERYNVYYTAPCVEANAANKREFVSQSVIPIDIDHVLDDHRKEVVMEVVKLLNLDYSKTVIVYSGHGVQLLIDTGIPWVQKSYFKDMSQHYKSMCDLINRRLKEKKLTGDVDGSVWSPARLMRLPFTLNIKREKGLPDKKAELVQANLEPQEEFNLARFSDNETFPVDKLQRITSIEKEAVLKCPYLQYCFENQATIIEPQWFAAIGILAFIPTEGRELCHLYSQGHPQYSYSDTEDKIVQAMKATGPRMCRSIEPLWDGCKTCEHRLANPNLSTPAMLHTEEYIKSQDTGFYTVTFSKTGEPKYTPDYEGICKYFYKIHKFVTVKESKEVYAYNKEKGIWYQVFKSELSNFAMLHFNPKGNSKQWLEFAHWVESSNLQSSSFLTSGSKEGLVNMKSNVFDIQNSLTLEHSPEYGFMNVLPFDYDHEATCPNFDKFMLEITGGCQETVNLLLEYCGYAIGNIPCHRFEKCLILTGEGSNGKSVFIDTIKYIFGPDNCSAVRLSDLADPQQRFACMGKLANIPSEENKAGLKDPAVVKAMVSGEAVVVKQLYSQPFSAAVQAKHIIACNDVPAANDTSQGIYRRMIIVPFNKSFTEELGNIDIELREKLKLEAAGIFNRILEGYLRLVKNKKFTAPNEVKARGVDYQIMNDPVAMWVQENLELNDSTDFYTMTQVYSMFKQWSDDRRLHQINYIKFCKDLRRALKSENRFCRKDINGMKHSGLTGVTYVGNINDF